MYNQIAANKRKTWVIITLFIAFVVFIGYLLDAYLGGNGGILVIAGCVSLVMTISGYFSGDKVALASAGARPTSQTDNPYVYRLVENLAITAGLPMPKLYIINDPAINAFATGRDPRHASIAVTTGAIERLENEELEGVLAHELSHIGNYDIRLMTIVLVLVGLLALLADWFYHIQWLGGNRDSDNRSNGWLAVFGIILIVLSPIIGQLIQFAVSRRREFLADASAALLTRYPEGLARALEKIKVDARPMSSANNATAHLYIANPFGSAKKLMSTAFSTHPPIDERITALRTMGA